MHPILFKILWLAAWLYSFSSVTKTFAANTEADSTQALSKAEHCIALEENLNTKSRWPGYHVDIYLNYLEKCQPSIEQKFGFYNKLIAQLLSQDNISLSIIESVEKAVNHLLDQIPPYSDTQSLQEWTTESFQNLYEQKEGIAFHIFSPASYNFNEPLFVSQEIQKVTEVPLNITNLSQYFSTSLSVCKNEKEFQYLLKPMDAFLQEVVFLSLQSVHYEQLRSFQQLYALYRSLQPIEDEEKSSPPDFISWTQMPPDFIDFLSNAVDWENPAFQNHYDWLKPALASLKIRARVREKMKTYCLPYQPFSNQEFAEHHYIVQVEKNDQNSQSKRKEVFNKIQEALEKQSSIFFMSSHTSSANDRMYLYVITLYSE